MASKIKILSSEVINRIAAGEVIDRPYSVVRELVENAIDANSSAITISIANGGKSTILISDNGEGMSKVDLQQSFKRHATSKIRTDEDLNIISSLVFPEIFT